MKCQIYLFDDVLVPVPDCADLIEIFGRRRGFNTPSKVANEMVREARVWQRNNPGKDVLEIVTQDWREYIKANL